MVAAQKIKRIVGTLSLTSLVVLVILPLIVGTSIAGYFVGVAVQKDRYTDFLRSFVNIRENSDKYTLINPLVGGSSNPATEVGIFSDLHSTLLSYFKNEEAKGELYAYSLYFRDLSTGFWFGVNEGDEFSPASLLKLPIAIAVYKEGEDTPNFLRKMVVYTKELDDINDSITANSQSILVVGKAYSIEELVKIMLTQSDNGAKNLLVTALDKSYLNKLFTVVSLDDPQTSSTYHISSIKYALFLRMLYGASYLNDDNSELLLGYLVQSTFNDGLVAGVPKRALVAHKYGVYQFNDLIRGREMPVQQLNDCGIVYHEKKPYVLCMMAKGKDLDSLYRVYKFVSSTVYSDREREEQEDK
jgi:beta-lactamase class A